MAYSLPPVSKGKKGYYKARIHGKHLARRAPRGGNTSLGAGVSLSYCYWRVPSYLNTSAQCQYHYVCEGTTLDSMVDKSITALRL